MIFKMIFYSICVTLKKQLRPLELPPLVGRFSINYRRIQRVSPIHLYTSRSISPHSLRFGISCVLNESRRKYTMNLWNTLFGKALMTFFISMCPFWSCAAPFPLEPPMSASLGCHSDLHCWKSGPSSLYYHLYSENLRLAAPKKSETRSPGHPFGNPGRKEIRCSTEVRLLGAFRSGGHPTSRYRGMDWCPGGRHAGHAPKARLPRHRPGRHRGRRHRRLCHLRRRRNLLRLKPYGTPRCP